MCTQCNIFPYQQRSYSIIHNVRPSVFPSKWRKRNILGSYSRQTAEILCEDSSDICASNLHRVLSICLLFGVLDRFLDFKFSRFSQFLCKIEGFPISFIIFELRYGCCHPFFYVYCSCLNIGRNGRKSHLEEQSDITQL